MRVEAFQTDDMYVPPSTGTFARNYPEPISTREATKRTIEIFDASYEKSNLPEVVKDTCGHLSSIDQKQLPRMKNCSMKLLVISILIQLSLTST